MKSIAIKIRFPSTRCHHFRSALRGLTLVETMISSVIFALVTAVVVWLMFQTALTSKDMFAETHTRATRMRALDEIRYQLMEAQIGSVAISQNNRRIEYVDPNLATTSVYFFNPQSGTLFYDADIGDGTPATGVASGPIDLTFESIEEGAIVRLNVRTSAEVGFGDVDTQEGETLIYLRNV